MGRVTTDEITTTDAKDEMALVDAEAASWGASSEDDDNNDRDSAENFDSFKISLQMAKFTANAMIE